MGSGHPVRVLAESNPVVINAVNAVCVDLLRFHLPLQVLVAETRKVGGNPLAGVVAEGYEHNAGRVQNAVGAELPHTLPGEGDGCLHGILGLYFQHQHAGRFCPLVQVLI